MNARRAPLLGLTIGATVAAVALLTVAASGMNKAKGPCAPAPKTSASVKQASATLPTMASVALPAPPPIKSPLGPVPSAKPSGRSAPQAVAPTKSATPIKPAKVETTVPAVSPTSAAADAQASPEPAIQSFGPSQPLIAAREREIEGRPLLRMLEHGKGPIVEIAWPEHRVARAKLYELLRRCHGLETVLLRGQEVLMNSTGGTPGAFDGDRHSGFLRAVIGASPRRETEILRALKDRHGGAGTTPARLLSRAFDARLLGGLAGLAGPGYREAGKVTARYAIAGRRVMVSAITVDGRDVVGRFEIDPAKRCVSS